MAKSTAHANAVLDAIGGATTIAAQTWVSLHTGNPGTTGASEVSGGSYARVRVNQNGSTSPYWNTAASAAMTNNGAITFPEGGGDAAVTHFGLWTATSAGTFIRGGALDTGFTYASNVTPEFATTALELTEA
jgi:hypothetical protein